MSEPKYTSTSEDEEFYEAKHSFENQLRMGVSGPRKRKPSAKLRRDDSDTSSVSMGSAFGASHEDGRSAKRSKVGSSFGLATKGRLPSQVKSSSHSASTTRTPNAQKKKRGDVASTAGASTAPSDNPEELLGATVEVRPGQLRDQFMCHLCGGCIRNCQTLSHCLHKFCRACLIKHAATSSVCPRCDAKIGSKFENWPTDDPVFEGLMRAIYPLPQAIYDGVQQTWDALVHSGESFGSLCVKYNVPSPSIRRDSNPTGIFGPNMSTELQRPPAVTSDRSMARQGSQVESTATSTGQNPTPVDVSGVAALLGVMEELLTPDQAPSHVNPANSLERMRSEMCLSALATPNTIPHVAQ